MLERQSPHTAPHGICEEEEQPPLELEWSSGGTWTGEKWVGLAEGVWPGTCKQC